MIKQSLRILAMLALLASPVFAQDTFFSYDFEFDGVPPEGFPLIEISELNEGSITGEWSGDDFQLGDPSGQFAVIAACQEECDSSGIVENPHGGSMMFIDRPVAPATHLMNLTEAIQLAGAEFSVTVGTRRTGGGAAEPKSYDFFGLDSEGNESFRIRIGADGARERLGYVTGGQPFYDLPTVEGEDMIDDIANTGGVPFGVNDDIVVLTVRTGSSGYTVEYENLNASNAYKTDTLAFNGAGKDLAQVGLSYGGVEGATGQQVGFIVDDTVVTGFTDLLLGDFDFNDKVDMADFLALANNFGKVTSNGDFDFSGKVNLQDWIGFKAAYNAFNAPAGAAASVPEPASGLLLCFGLLLGLFARRRRR